MNIAFSKLCREINFIPNNEWDRVFLISANLKEDKVFHISLQADDILPVKEIKEFLAKLSKNFKYKSRPEFSIIRRIFDKQKVINYIVWVLNEILDEVKISEKIENSNSEIDLDGNIEFSSIPASYIKKYQKIEKKLLYILGMFGLSNLKISLESKPNSFEEQKTQEMEIAKFLNKKTETAVKNKKNKWENLNQRNSIYVPIDIDELRESGEEKVEVFGSIFSINSFTTKQGVKIFTIEITNFKEALSLKKFLRDERDISYFNSLKIGDKIKVRGLVNSDKYQNDIFININQIKVIPIITKNKKQIERIELNTRTKMSVMDGITSPEEYYNRAKELNQNAIAVTDLNNIQAFPNFNSIMKKDNDFKVIYGTTINVVNNSRGIVSKKIEGTIKDQTYVVFDLETTGLFAKYNGIIEFGACKVQGGKIVEEKQFLINPQQKISSKIEELTNISNKDIKNSITEKTAMEEILAYFGDCVLIAHNATFDISFINKKIEKYNLKKLKNCIIDTLPLSRAIVPKVKRHTLERFAMRNDVEYSKSEAHRADYDAIVLAKTWIKTIEKLSEIDIESMNDLWNFNFSKHFLRQRGNPITLLAKNNIGLKNLFTLISLSHTTNFNGYEQILKEDIIKYREGLLVGSPGANGIVWDAELTKTQKELEEEISFFDYIEVNPIENFTHLIHRGDIELIDVRNAIKNIIGTSKNIKKIVVATSESRYLDKQDKFIHQIYIESKGLGGVAHNLFKYNEVNPKYPCFYFRNTKEMKFEFHFLDDDELINEIVVKNTNLISDSIERIEVIKNGLFTPKIKNSKENIIALTYKNAKQIYGETLPSIVKKRIEKELNLIINNGYDVIYWIAHLLVKKSMEEGYLVGSRGSVGSSLVATLTGITEVNPLSPHYHCSKCQYTEFPENSISKSGYDLPEKNCINCDLPLKKDGHSIPFETFLGFGGEKIPDIDLNFSGEYQKTIHNEVRRIFGEEHCFRAGTISTIAQRTAFGYVKAWTEEKNSDFSKTYINYLTQRLSGTKRTTGQHPGGIIIVPKEYIVEDFTPINFPANDAASSWKTTHFDFNAIHNNLLKLDLLGHDDPTAIRMLQNFTGIKPNEIPNSDKKVLSLFKNTESLGITSDEISGETTGVMGIPEFGTPFVRQILKSVNVKSFSDLISISGLSHGTDVWINNAQQDVKHKGLTIEQIISCRDDILNDLTEYGVDSRTSFIIMEQVRKGKSITEDQKEIMLQNNVPDWYIESCKKIKYMFPKAHATAYVKMAWRVAWFKIYYPLPYYATYFSIRAKAIDIEKMIASKSAIHNTLKILKKKINSRSSLDKISNKEKDLIPVLELCEELHARGYKIIPVDMELSKATHWGINYDKKALIPPFNVIEGLGDIVAKSIIDERNKKSFISIEDLKNRTSINKTSIQELRAINSLNNIPERNQLSLFE